MNEAGRVAPAAPKHYYKIVVL